jgi:hypothetical protein
MILVSSQRLFLGVISTENNHEILFEQEINQKILQDDRNIRIFFYLTNPFRSKKVELWSVTSVLEPCKGNGRLRCFLLEELATKLICF